jgi:4-hydroxybenzoate polyprenyltransferase
MLTALIQEMRPRQWLKNGLIFAALIFDRQLNELPALFTIIAGAGLFSLLASTVYIINDLSDVEVDRAHPTKRNRPIASGKLPINVARGAVAALLVLVVPAMYLLSPAFMLLSLAYFALNLSYSFWLKHIPIIDVLVLASFYIIRVAAGVVLIRVERFSPWLYVAILFLALFMGIGKRRAELVSAMENNGRMRKVLESYTLPYLDQLIMIVLTIAILTYSLYTFSAPNLPENHSMMLTIPFVIYGIFRYLYLMQVEGHGEAPEEVMLSDRPLQITLVVWGLVILLIFYTY